MERAIIPPKGVGMMVLFSCMPAIWFLSCFLFFCVYFLGDSLFFLSVSIASLPPFVLAVLGERMYLQSALFILALIVLRMIGWLAKRAGRRGTIRASKKRAVVLRCVDRHGGMVLYEDHIYSVCTRDENLSYDPGVVFLVYDHPEKTGIPLFYRK